VQTVQKLLLVDEGELDVDQLQSVFATIGRVIEARQVCDVSSLCDCLASQTIIVSFNTES